MSQENDTYDLGTCCVCEGTENIRNILMLDKRAPMPGRGWGCVVCGLLQDGASAVVCDDCLEKPLKWACRGYPGIDGRIRIEELTESFHHNYRYHADELLTRIEQSYLSLHPGNNRICCRDFLYFDIEAELIAWRVLKVDFAP